MQLPFIRQRRRSGFTMVETLLVASLMAVIVIALSRGLISGVRLWEQSLYADRLIDVSLFFDKLSRDLRQSFDYSLFEFEGKGSDFTFTTLVNTPADANIPELNGQMVEQPGRVQYKWDRLKKNVVRRVANYGQSIEDEFGEAQVLVEGIRFMQLRYYYSSSGNQRLLRKVRGTKELPALIELTIEVEDRTGNGVRFQRFFDLPAGQYPNGAPNEGEVNG